MSSLNYNHLYYFYLAAREGGITAAARHLRLAQPTVSGQIRQLEDSLGSKLFQKAGRGVQLTELGRLVYQYADEIFSLGQELADVAQGRPAGRPARLLVGVADVLPKLLIHRFVEPALSLPDPLRVVCKTDRLDNLLGELSVHRLDLVLADSPISPTVNVRAYNHLLGETDVAFFAAPSLASRVRRNFPESLNEVPFLFPGEHTVLRRSLDSWFDSHGIRPRMAGEFSDSALLKTFGQAGVGVFAAPSVMEAEICRQYHVKHLGTIAAIRERFYAISVERRIKHPGVLAISNAAQALLE